MDYDSPNGTSIHDLQSRGSQVGSRDLRDNLQGMPQNLQQQMQQRMQQSQRQQLPQRQQLSAPKQAQEQEQEEVDVEELAKHINKNINEGKGRESEDDDDKDDEDKFNMSLPKNFKEPLLFLAIYVVMSFATVREFLGTYITYLNPNEEGVVSFAGIIIYGVIMVSLFMMGRKFL